MAGARCSECGREEFLPFRCKLCAQPHCLDHRLPENHRCQGLGGYRSRAREERVAAVPRPAPEGVRLKVRGGAAAGAYSRRVARWFRRSTTHRVLGLLLLVYLFQWVGGLLLGLATGVDPLRGVGQLTCALALGDCLGAGFGPAALLAKPWSPLTSLFAHSVNPLHLLFNALFLYFFGLALEERVGGRRLLVLFLATGLAAGFVQVLVFGGAVLGASGAIMGLVGALTVLAPNMQVSFWFIPMPLWIMALLFVLFDLSGAANGAGGIAHVAHLVGLAGGLVWGLRVRRRGVIPRLAQPWAFQRRG
jgi:hypothetical protein